MLKIILSVSVLALIVGCGTSAGENAEESILKIYPKESTLTYRETNSSIPKPTLGHPVVDEVFRTKISRLDAPVGQINDYPKIQAWNADMSLIRIKYRLYDGETLLETSFTKGKSGDDAYTSLCSPTAGYFRWSNMDASVFYTIQSNGKLIKGKILKDSISCDEIVEDFSDFEVISLGEGEGNIDYHDKHLLLMAKKENDTAMYLILYDLQEGKRIWTKNLEGRSWKYVIDKKDPTKNYWAAKELDWVSISPSGAYIVVNEINKNNYTEGLSVYDSNLSNHHYLQYSYHDKIYSEGGHGDMGYDIYGNEVYVGFLVGLPVHMFELAHPERLGKAVLKSPYGGGHVSCRNTKRPGWCTVTTSQEGYNEIFSLKLDGNDTQRVERFSQSHNRGYIDPDTDKLIPYPATFGTPSPDGTKVIFNSKWEGDRATLSEVFVAEGVK